MYQPSQKTLEKYADLLVNFALHAGKGVKKGEVVLCIVDDVAKPLLIELHKAVLKAGAHPMLRLIPTGINKDFYKYANDSQLTFFPEKYVKARCDTIDHQIGIISEVDPFELQKVDSQKIFKAMQNKKKVREWLDEKEHRGKYTWTLALYGTGAMAKEAGMSLKEYWKIIEQACYLDKKDPIAEWKKIHKEQERVMKKLNAMKIQSVHVQGRNIDLRVKIGSDRAWFGGSGRNIPSYEIFTSPDWRGTEGYIYFNQPLYRYGNRAEGIRLEFNNGKVVKVDAKKGKKLIENMLKQKNADKLGEFSLTDSRVSRITKFTANTLFDENIGGRYGNTHVAIGAAYKDCYAGDPSKPTKKQWDAMGFNDSVEHTDMMSTEDRTVTATLSDGSEKVIYADGKFTV